jgi:microcystin-dependent protein
MSNLLGGPGYTGPADQRPLSDQEFSAVQRLLSDPLSFPLEFKAWLVSYLETSDLTLPMNSILGLQKTLGITGAGQGTLGIFPAGLILPYGGDTAPTGSYLCDGSAKNRTTDARLFNAIGVRYGAPDANTFNLPDMQGRPPVGKGPHGDVATLGQSEGLGAASRTPKHTHRLPGDGTGNASTAGGSSDGNIMLTDYGPNAHTIPEPGKPVDSGGYLVVNFIIVR